MAIGYAPKEDLAFHVGHKVEVVSYFDGESITIECNDCGCVLIDTPEPDPEKDWSWYNETYA